MTARRRNSSNNSERSTSERKELISLCKEESIWTLGAAGIKDHTHTPENDSHLFHSSFPLLCSSCTELRSHPSPACCFFFVGFLWVVFFFGRAHWPLQHEELVTAARPCIFKRVGRAQSRPPTAAVVVPTAAADADVGSEMAHAHKGGRSRLGSRFLS